MDLAEAVSVAVTALRDGTPSGNGDSERRALGVTGLEVAVLDQSRPRRTFRRIAGAALEPLLPAPSAPKQESAEGGEAGGAPDTGNTTGSD